MCKRVSVVMPIYNTEKYIEETVESVISQTLGFEENIQLILVNDGSCDRSGQICKQYAARYPDNILYINLPSNQGVSAARNTGMKAATGKYITFMDSDDMWSVNAFQRAVDYLEENSEIIDLVSADVESFDAYYELHLLNRGLKEDAIVDMNKQYSWIRSNGPTCIMKREVAQLYCFNENQKCWEDTVFVNQIMQRKQRFGMLATDVIYYYRRRRENTSAVQSYGKNKEYFLHELSELFNGIYQGAMKQCGSFIPMAQYLIAYALGYRFWGYENLLNKEEIKVYNAILHEVIEKVEDKYIAEIPNADDMTKKMMLAYKHGVDFRSVKKKIDELQAENNSLRKRLDRTNMNYKLLKKWFTLREKGKSLRQYFESYGYQCIAIYGMSDLGQFLLDELQGSKIKVAYAIDRRAEKLSADVDILTMEDDLPVVNIVVVTAVYFYNQIAEELKEKMECPILSLEDILYSFET